MVGGRPVSEFHLSDELWLYPPVVFHRLRCQGFATPGRLGLGEIGERTRFGFKLPQVVEDLLLQARGKAVFGSSR